MSKLERYFTVYSSLCYYYSEQSRLAREWVEEVMFSHNPDTKQAHQIRQKAIYEVIQNHEKKLQTLRVDLTFDELDQLKLRAQKKYA